MSRYRWEDDEMLLEQLPDMPPEPGFTAREPVRMRLRMPTVQEMAAGMPRHVETPPDLAGVVPSTAEEMTLAPPRTELPPIMVEAARPVPIVEGTIMQRGPGAGYGDERAYTRPLAPGWQNEEGRTPVRYTRYEPMSVAEAQEAGFVQVAGDGGTRASFDRFAGQLQRGDRVREALRLARAKDDDQMSVHSPAVNDPERVVRWGRGGPTNAINREVDAVRRERRAQQYAEQETDRAIREARETPQAVGGYVGTAVYDPETGWQVQGSEGRGSAAKRQMTDKQFYDAVAKAEEIRKGNALRGQKADPEAADLMLRSLQQMRPDLWQATFSDQQPQPQGGQPVTMRDKQGKLRMRNAQGLWVPVPEQ